MNNSRATEITRIVLYAMSIFLIILLAILSCQKILDFKYDTQSDEVMLNVIIVSVDIIMIFHDDSDLQRSFVRRMQ